jgi:adenosine kinase
VLIDSVTACGVEGYFEVSAEEPTSTCAVVVVGKERTLCANIAAARKFSLEYLNAHMVSELKLQNTI